MKTCPVCAVDLDDTYLFCPEDGSILGSLPDRSEQSEPERVSEADDEPSGAAVLCCPVCAAEYPLTFSKCPVHDAQLTKHRIAGTESGGSRPLALAGDAQAAVAEPQVQPGQTKAKSQLTSLDLKRPEMESPNRFATSKTDGDDNEVAQADVVSAFASPADDAFADGVTAYDYQRFLPDTTEGRLERPGFRVAAIATVIALVLFGIVAIYSFVSNLSRHSSSHTVKLASTAESAPQPLPFVPTPKAAQDYKEPEPAPAEPTFSEPAPERSVERVRNETPATSLSGRDTRMTPVTQPPPKAPTSSTAPLTTTRVSNQTELPPVPRGNSGGFDARLIRVRSRKTSAGVRYDLTFNMQEQGGRSTQWQRVLISTRSANGTSHSEAIPFSHRLGAAGALTFTISVELTGRTEADWQGRVVCTTLGWDNKGAPLQASFGASVAP